MRYLAACGLVLGVALAGLADGPTLKEARQRWLRGNYEEARGHYETLAKDAQTRVAAVIGISRCRQSQGEYDKALEVIDAALADHKDNADLHARRAELLHIRGRWDDAAKAAEAALAASKEHFLARWVRAQLYRDRGDLKEADAEFRWFVRTYTTRSEQDKEITDPDELLLVGLAGTENARWHNLSDQYKVILNDVYGDALKADKDFWPAESQAGLLLLEKYNRGEALDAFDKALKINANAAEALVGKGIAALQKFEIKDADQHVQRALQINPNLPDALRLRADLHLAAGEVAAGARDLEKARKINPRDESTLGRLAACLLLQKKDAAFAALCKEAEKHDPKAGVFYFELAERLEERRQFDAAEKYFKKAIELRPMLPWAQNSLGMLHMRLGREKEAREILTRAFQADSFNVRVANTLKVLRHLDKYETIRTEHFELRYDPKTDAVLARYMAGHLEAVYAELAEQFQYKPKGPILIEVFNNHEMFSGRTVALPDLHTIGACTGRMVAMVSPKGKGINKPFNWSRVVRHELVHIFNLEQTNFQCPHWLTEGLAVSYEGFARPQSWNELLRERVPAGKLMNLDDIQLGFVKPKNFPEDWHMAYCQSQLYVQYLKEKHGPQAVAGLLAAYGDGLDTGAAIAKVCGVDKADFEKGYRAFLEDTVKGLQGRPVEKPLNFKQLQQAHEREPDNGKVAAQLASAYLLRKRNTEARKLAEKVLAKDKKHPLALYVKAKLMLAAGDEDEARALLESAIDAKAPEPRAFRELGKLYFENGEFDRAAALYELARKIEPLESDWLVELARVYTQSGDKGKLIAVLKELAPTDPDDLDVRKRLARLYVERGEFADAERYARQALEIDVLDAEAQSLTQRALKGQKKDAEAEQLQKLLGK